jgi:hypothetical protein
MARKRTTRRHSKGKKGRNLLNKTFKKGLNTSKKYMPAIKTGLENVGDKVTKTGRNLFSMIGKKKR